MTLGLDRRTLLCGAAVLAAPRAWAAQDTRLAGDWSAVIPNSPTSMAILRMRISARGEVTGLPGAAVTAGDVVEQPASPRPVRAIAESVTPERIVIRWPDRQNPGVMVGRLTDAGRIEGAIAAGAASGRSFPLRYEPGRIPSSLTLAQPVLTPEGAEASRMVLNLPGLVIGAERRGAPRRFWKSGVRVLAGSAPAALEDRWMLGSVTKSMTSTLVARLVEAGLIGWDDRVGDVLKDIAPEIRPEYRDVTYRHILSHRSMMPRDVSAGGQTRAQRGYAQDPMAVRRDLAREALRRPPIGMTEGTYAYSNLAYAVAGAMMEARTGRSWDELMRRHLFEPLGLSSAGVGPPQGDQPWGHDGRRPMDPTSPGSDLAYGPSGKAHISIGDLLTYLAVHRDRTSFLSADSWRTLHTPPFGGNYAMGWNVTPSGRLFHNGSNRFWYATAIIDGDRVAASLTNRGQGGATAQQAWETV